MRKVEDGLTRGLRVGVSSKLVEESRVEIVSGKGGSGLG